MAEHHTATKGLVFFDRNAVVVTSEWNGVPKVITVSHEVIETDAGHSLEREEALAFVHVNSDHYIALARKLDAFNPSTSRFQVVIDHEILDGRIGYSARREQQELRAAALASDKLSADLHLELAALHSENGRALQRSAQQTD